MSSSAHVPLVVIADDEPEDIVRLERALEATGLRHKVIALPSGESAMNYLQRWLAVTPGDNWLAHALLVLDWRMPAADGLAVLRWVRSQPRLQEFQVLIISNSERPEDLEVARQAGASACLSKNLPLEELTEIFSAALQSSLGALQKTR